MDRDETLSLLIAKANSLTAEVRALRMFTKALYVVDLPDKARAQRVAKALRVIMDSEEEHVRETGFDLQIPATDALSLNDEAHAACESFLRWLGEDTTQPRP